MPDAGRQRGQVAGRRVERALRRADGRPERRGAGPAVGGGEQLVERAVLEPDVRVGHQGPALVDVGERGVGRRAVADVAAGAQQPDVAVRGRHPLGDAVVGAVVGEHDVQRPDRGPAQAGDELDQRLARRVRHDDDPQRPAHRRAPPRRRPPGGPGAGPPVERRGPGQAVRAASSARPARVGQQGAEVRGDRVLVRGRCRRRRPRRSPGWRAASSSARGRRRPSPRAPAARTPRPGSGRPRAAAPPR